MGSLTQGKSIERRMHIVGVISAWVSGVFGPFRAGGQGDRMSFGRLDMGVLDGEWEGTEAMPRLACRWASRPGRQPRVRARTPRAA